VTLQKRWQAITREHIVAGVILLNSLVLFLLGFPSLVARYGGLLFNLDYFFTVFFVVEIVLKVRHRGWRGFWQSRWNRFDFWVVLLSSPMLFSPFFDTHEFGVILIGRLARFLKLARFIPDCDKLWAGLQRALMASVGIIFAIFIYNFILAIAATSFFSSVDPEHFGDPLLSMYTLFKVFTVEGWFDFPDLIAEHASPLVGAFARLFFVFAVLSGGIIGLSIANAVFVDEMVMDNNDGLERRIVALEERLVEKLDALQQDLQAGSSSEN
jgi:voltage-gated sodium channel